MEALLGTVFIASLLGSLHCVGMCGPFALLASADPQRRQAAIIPTLAYSTGRLVTYAIVGLIFGTLGMAINGIAGQGAAFQGESISNWQQLATYAAGGFMLVVGLIALARQFGMRISLPQAFGPVQKVLQGNFRRATRLRPVWRALSIGMLTSLMPCGWLYTFAIGAAGTGSPLWGMVLMIVFWMGTVPIMTALVLGVNQISQPIQKKIPLVMAVLVVLLGIFTIMHRAPVSLNHEAKVVSDIQQVNVQLGDVDQETLPCCHSK